MVCVMRLIRSLLRIEPNSGFERWWKTWDNAAVRGSAIADVIKVWVWAVGSLVLGLWLTPFAFNGGKALSELSATKDFNGMVNKLAAWSGAAGLEDFFKFCWPLTALLLLFPLIEWLRLGNDRVAGNPWGIRLPHHAVAGATSGQAIESNPRGPLYGLAGFVIAFGCFVLIGAAMVKAGSFVKNQGVASLREGIWFDMGLVLVVALLVEIFFRRVILGIFLRAMKPSSAIGLAALMFAGIPFILSGFDNASRVDGETLSAFQLTAILFGGGDLLSRFIVVFFPWFAFGFVLGWARWRTASVWLSSGLLTGWLLVDRLFAKATQAVEIPDRVAAYFVAESVQNGIIPLLGVVVVGGLVHVITHGYPFKRNAEAGD